MQATTQNQCTKSIIHCAKLTKNVQNVQKGTQLQIIYTVTNNVHNSQKSKKKYKYCTYPANKIFRQFLVDLIYEQSLIYKHKQCEKLTNN